MKIMRTRLSAEDRKKLEAQIWDRIWNKEWERKESEKSDEEQQEEIRISQAEEMALDDWKYGDFYGN